MHLEKQEEEEMVLNMTRLREVMEGTRVMNPTQGGSTKDVLREYIGQLSCDTLVRLYRRYWPDFVLFQYEVGEMMSWGEGGQGCQQALSWEEEEYVK